jgi:hypothetical protein
MITGPDGQPQVRIVFTLHDGTNRQKICGYVEALKQLAEAKRTPSLWKDFKIEAAWSAK